MVGGSLLLNGIRSMMGGHQQSFADSGAIGDRAAVHGAINPTARWRATPASTISAGADGHADGNSGHGLFDQASDDGQVDDDPVDTDPMDLDADDFGSDGGSDYATDASSATQTSRTTI